MAFPDTTKYLFNSFTEAVVFMVWPIKTLLFTVNNILTKRDYTYSIDDFSDFILFVCIGYWVYTFLIWASVESQETFVTTRIENYVYQVMSRMDPNTSEDSDFKINIFLVIISFCIWMRFLLMLQLTKIFGPMLRIIITMIGEVLTFLFIWIIILVTLTSIS